MSKPTQSCTGSTSMMTNCNSTILNPEDQTKTSKGLLQTVTASHAEQATPRRNYSNAEAAKTVSFPLTEFSLQTDRMKELKTVTWTTTQALNATLYTVTSSEIRTALISLFDVAKWNRLARFNPVVTMVASTTPYAAGMLLLAYYPPEFAEVSGHPLYDLDAATMLEHTRLNISSKTTASVKGCFKRAARYNILEDQVWNSFGSFICRVYNPLTASDAGVTVNITVYVSVEDLDLRLLSAPTAAFQAEVTPEDVKEVIRRPQTQEVVEEAGFLSFIRDVAQTISAVGKAVITVGGLIADRPDACVHDEWAVMDTPAPVSRLQYLTTDYVGEDFGVTQMPDSHKYMRVDNYMKQMVRINQYLWTTSSQVNAVLFTININPTSIQTFGPLQGNVPAHWRGTIDFVLEVIKTPFHIGTLIAVVHPASVTPVRASQGDNPSYLLDITVATTFQFSVGHLGHQDYRGTTDPDWKLSLLVKNPLKALNAGTSIAVNSYAMAGEDFQFAFASYPLYMWHVPPYVSAVSEEEVTERCTETVHECGDVEAPMKSDEKTKIISTERTPITISTDPIPDSDAVMISEGKTTISGTVAEGGWYKSTAQQDLKLLLQRPAELNRVPQLGRLWPTTQTSAGILLFRATWRDLVHLIKASRLFLYATGGFRIGYVSNASKMEACLLRIELIFNAGQQTEGSVELRNLADNPCGRFGFPYYGKTPMLPTGLQYGYEEGYLIQIRLLGQPTPGLFFNFTVQTADDFIMRVPVPSWPMSSMTVNDEGGLSNKWALYQGLSASKEDKEREPRRKPITAVNGDSSDEYEVLVPRKKTVRAMADDGSHEVDTKVPWENGKENTSEVETDANKVSYVLSTMTGKNQRRYKVVEEFPPVKCTHLFKNTLSLAATDTFIPDGRPCTSNIRLTVKPDMVEAHTHHSNSCYVINLQRRHGETDAQLCDRASGAMQCFSRVFPAGSIKQISYVRPLKTRKYIDCRTRHGYRGHITVYIYRNDQMYSCGARANWEEIATCLEDYINRHEVVHEKGGYQTKMYQDVKEQAKEDLRGLGEMIKDEHEKAKKSGTQEVQDFLKDYWPVFAVKIPAYAMQVMSCQSATGIASILLHLCGDVIAIVRTCETLTNLFTGLLSKVSNLVTYLTAPRECAGGKDTEHQDKMKCVYKTLKSVVTDTLGKGWCTFSSFVSFLKPVALFGQVCRGLQYAFEFFLGIVQWFGWLLSGKKKQAMNAKEWLEKHKEEVAETVVDMKKVIVQGDVHAASADQEVHAKIISLRTKGVDYQEKLASLKDDPEIQSVFKVIDLFQSKTKIVPGLPGSAQKFEPVFLLLDGAAGLGKTTVAQTIAQTLSTLVSGSAESIFFCTAGQDYWTGYYGQQIIVMDDLFQDPDVKGVASLTQLISSMPCPLPMADIESKFTHSDAKVVIATSNSQKPTEGSLTEPTALMRRYQHTHFRIKKPGEWVKILQRWSDDRKQVNEYESQQTYTDEQMMASVVRVLSAKWEQHQKRLTTKPFPVSKNIIDQFADLRKHNQKNFSLIAPIKDKGAECDLKPEEEEEDYYSGDEEPVFQTVPVNTQDGETQQMTIVKPRGRRNQQRTRETVEERAEGPFQNKLWKNGKTVRENLVAGLSTDILGDFLDLFDEDFIEALTCKADPLYRQSWEQSMKDAKHYSRSEQDDMLNLKGTAVVVEEKTGFEIKGVIPKLNPDYKVSNITSMLHNDFCKEGDYQQGATWVMRRASQIAHESYWDFYRRALHKQKKTTTYTMQVSAAIKKLGSVSYHFVKDIMYATGLALGIFAALSAIGGILRHFFNVQEAAHEAGAYDVRPTRQRSKEGVTFRGYIDRKPIIERAQCEWTCWVSRDTPLRVKCVDIGGGYIIVNRHAVKMGAEHTLSWDQGGRKMESSIPVMANNVYYFQSEKPIDAAIVYVGTAKPFGRDIANYFWSNDQFTSFKSGDAVLVIKGRDDIPREIHGNAWYDGETNMTSRSYSGIRSFESIRIHGHVAGGDCGNVMYLNDEEGQAPLMGIVHAGGDLTACIAPVTREAIKAARTSLQESRLLPEILVENPVNSCCAIGYEEHKHEFRQSIDYLITKDPEWLHGEGAYEIMDKKLPDDNPQYAPIEKDDWKYNHLNVETTIQKTTPRNVLIVADCDLDTDKQPVLLHRRKSKIPIMGAAVVADGSVLLNAIPVGNVEYTAAQFATEKLVEHLEKFIGDCEPLTEKQILNHWIESKTEGYRESTGMKASSASGRSMDELFGKHKRGGHCDYGMDGEKTLKPAVRAHIQKIEKEMRKGKCFDRVVEGHLKDELRSPEKFLEGKTRLFFVDSMELWYISKKYLGGFFAWYRSAPAIVSRHTIGSDPAQMWNEWGNHFSESSVMASDVSGWDTSVTGWLIDIIRFVIEFFHIPCPKEDTLIRQMLMEQLAWCNVSVGGWKYLASGLKSGTFCTTELNSLIHTWVLFYTMYRTHQMAILSPIAQDKPFKEVFEEFTESKFLVNGDDSLLSAAASQHMAEPEKFPELVTQGYAECGFKLVNGADKTLPPEVISLKDAIYLKRGFKPLEANQHQHTFSVFEGNLVVWAPTMDLQTVGALLLYSRKNALKEDNLKDAMVFCRQAHDFWNFKAVRRVSYLLGYMDNCVTWDEALAWYTHSSIEEHLDDEFSETVTLLPGEGKVYGDSAMMFMMEVVVDPFVYQTPDMALKIILNMAKILSRADFYYYLVELRKIYQKLKRSYVRGSIPISVYSSNMMALQQFLDFPLYVASKCLEVYCGHRIHFSRDEELALVARQLPLAAIMAHDMLQVLTASRPGIREGADLVDVRVQAESMEVPGYPPPPNFPITLESVTRDIKSHMAQHPPTEAEVCSGLHKVWVATKIIMPTDVPTPQTKTREIQAKKSAESRLGIFAYQSEVGKLAKRKKKDEGFIYKFSDEDSYDSELEENIFDDQWTSDYGHGYIHSRQEMRNTRSKETQELVSAMWEPVQACADKKVAKMQLVPKGFKQSEAELPDVQEEGGDVNIVDKWAHYKQRYGEEFCASNKDLLLGDFAHLFKE